MIYTTHNDKSFTTVKKFITGLYQKQKLKKIIIKIQHIFRYGINFADKS